MGRYAVRVAATMEFPEDLPFEGPYEFFFVYLVWLPLLFRFVLLPRPVLRVWRAHRENLPWMVRLLWSGVPGGRRLTMAMAYGFVLPILLGTAVRALGPFGWESWDETPRWAALLFLLGLAAMWVWDISRIRKAVALLRVVEAMKDKVKNARRGIDALQRVAKFVTERAEAEEDAGALRRARAKVFAKVRDLGRIPIDRALAKVEVQVEAARSRMYAGGVFIHLAPAGLLYLLAAVDAALRG